MEIGAARRGLEGGEPQPQEGTTTSPTRLESNDAHDLGELAHAIATSALSHAMTLGGELRRQLQRAAENTEAMPAEEQSYDIVIPAYNEAASLQSCLDSVLSNTDPRHLVHVVDDASADPKVDLLLRLYAERWAHLRYYRLPVSLGFPGAVNAALAATTRDVVLVNPDTELPPGWLGRLDRCRRSDPRIGAVSPLSNNASVCSVPRMHERNALPSGMTAASMDRLVARTSLHRYPRTPAVVDSCMLLTRHALNDVGLFDMAFDRGYGEDIDWCQRAWAKGFESVICDDVYVYHHGEVGFDKVPDKRNVQEANEHRLAQRWPRYHAALLAYSSMNPLRCQQQRIIDRLTATAKQRTNVLHVLHGFDSLTGTQRFVRQVAEGTSDEFRSTVLYPVDQRPWKDAVIEDDPAGILKVKMSMGMFPIDHVLRGAVLNLRSPNAERFFADVVAGTAAQVVHFSHLANLGSFALPLVARAVGARVVLVLHDYFMLCPDWNLMDANGRGCNRARAEDCPQCIMCLQSRVKTRPGVERPKWSGFLRERAVLARLALEQADAIVTPSECVREHFGSAFGASLADRIRVIPHASPTYPYRASYKPEEQLRVACVGHITLEKGRDVFLEAARRLRGSSVRFRVIGELLPRGGFEPVEGMEVTGPYAPSDLPQLLQEVDVVFVGSICDETYCYTLDEAMRAGSPVIASRLGALKERVSEGRTGFLIPPGDPDALVRAIRLLNDERPLLDSMRRNVSALPWRTLGDNVAEYAKLFRGLAAVDVKSDIIRAAMRTNAHTVIPLPVRVEEVLSAAGVDLSLPLQPEEVAARATGAGKKQNHQGKHKKPKRKH